MAFLNPWRAPLITSTAYVESVIVSQEMDNEKSNKALAATLFSVIERHAPLLKIFLSDHGRAGFHIRFRDAFAEKVRSNLEKNESFNANIKVPMEYFLSFITSAYLGLIEQWVQNGLDKTPQEMTALYIDIISYIQKK